MKWRPFIISMSLTLSTLVSCLMPAQTFAAEVKSTDVIEPKTPKVSEDQNTYDAPELNCVWQYENGNAYWYEHGVRQGTMSDPQGVRWKNDPPSANRGREIYDSSSDAWYWLDSAYGGAKAVSKEVFMPYVYQNEASMSDAEKISNAQASDPGMQDYVLQLMRSGTGKWVRYDENGHMFKGWSTITSANCGNRPDQIGNTYYYDVKTGSMAKGTLTIDGQSYSFNETSGVLERGSAPNLNKPFYPSTQQMNQWLAMSLWYEGYFDIAYDISSAASGSYAKAQKTVTNTTDGQKASEANTAFHYKNGSLDNIVIDTDTFNSGTDEIKGRITYVIDSNGIPVSGTHGLADYPPFDNYISHKTDSSGRLTEYIGLEPFNEDATEKHFTYDINGRLTSADISLYMDNYHLTFTYDDHGRISKIARKDSSTGKLQMDHTFSYNPSGLMTSIHCEPADGSDALSTGDWQFKYDASGKLIEADNLYQFDFYRTKVTYTY